MRAGGDSSGGRGGGGGGGVDGGLGSSSGGLGSDGSSPRGRPRSPPRTTKLQLAYSIYGQAPPATLKIEPVRREGGWRRSASPSRRSRAAAGLRERRGAARSGADNNERFENGERSNEWFRGNEEPRHEIKVAYYFPVEAGDEDDDDDDDHDCGRDDDGADVAGRESYDSGADHVDDDGALRSRSPTLSLLAVAPNSPPLYSACSAGTIELFMSSDSPGHVPQSAGRPETARIDGSGRAALPAPARPTVGHKGAVRPQTAGPSRGKVAAGPRAAGATKRGGGGGSRAAAEVATKRFFAQPEKELRRCRLGLESVLGRARLDRGHFGKTALKGAVQVDLVKLAEVVNLLDVLERRERVLAAEATARREMDATSLASVRTQLHQLAEDVHCATAAADLARDEAPGGDGEDAAATLLRAAAWAQQARGVCEVIDKDLSVQCAPTERPNTIAAVASRAVEVACGVARAYADACHEGVALAGDMIADLQAQLAEAQAEASN